MYYPFVKETASAPGASTTFNLGGASAPFKSFATYVTTGSIVFYVMQDTTQAEWGYGTFTTGSPNTLTRTTVIGNTSNNTSKLTFAGTTSVYSYPVTVAYKDQNGRYGFNVAALRGTLDVLADTTYGSGLRVRGRASDSSGAVEFSTNDLVHQTGRLSFDSDGTMTLQGYDALELMKASATGLMRVNNPSYTTGQLNVKHSGSDSVIVTEITGTASQPAILFRNGNGQVGSITTSGSSTAFNTSSDHRLKVIHGAADPSFLDNIPVYDASFISDGSRYPMCLAHEIANAGGGFAVTGAKDAVDEDGVPVMQGVDYSKLVPALLAKVQDLEKRLMALGG